VAAAVVDGEAGVGDDGNGQMAVFAQIARWLVHVFGAGRAVEADHVDVERLQRHQGGRDVRAQQHAAAGVEGDLGLDGEAHASLLEGLAQAMDGGLHLQDVLGSLDQEEIDAARDQADGLFAKDVGQLGEGDVAEGGIAAGGQEAAGADGAGDEARLRGGGVAVGDAAGELGGGAVDLDHARLQAVFAQGDAIGAEGVGLDHIATDGQEGGVDALDGVGAREDQIVVTTVRAFAAEVGGGQVEALQVGAHGAVEDEDAPGESSEIMGMEIQVNAPVNVAAGNHSV